MSFERIKPIILLPQKSGSTVTAFQRVAESTGIPTVARKPLLSSVDTVNNYPAEKERDTYLIWSRSSRDTQSLVLAEKAVATGARVGLVALVMSPNLQEIARAIGVKNIFPDEMEFKKALGWLKNQRDIRSYLRQFSGSEDINPVSPFPWNNR